MTSAEYLIELRQRLRTLPPQEIEQAMSYYEEYFAEAGPEGEAEVINRIGTPAQVASAIYSDYAMKDMRGETEGGNKGSGLKTMWIVIIAVLASPIAIPLAIALIFVVIALIIALFSFFLALFAASLVMVVTGLVVAGFSIAGLFTQPVEAIMALGSALICLSLGVALGLGTIKLCQLTVRGITWVFARILGRKGGQR